VRDFHRRHATTNDATPRNVHVLFTPCKAESSQESSQGVIARDNISVKRAYQRG
jgi:hypothetical protein